MSITALLKHLLLGLLILTPLACNGQSQVSINNGNNQQFGQADHITVQEEFLYFYNIYGGQESLGDTLTEQIVVDGWLVQYFEKGRLEFHPENEPAYRVTVGWLGDLLNRRRPPIPPLAIPSAEIPNTRYYEQTGHTLSGDFLQYFDTHGGSVRFGLPISEPFLLDGQLTQDFQSGRFFWTPQASQTVTLEAIGRMHLEAITLQNK